MGLEENIRNGAGRRKHTYLGGRGGGCLGNFQEILFGFADHLFSFHHELSVLAKKKFKIEKRKENCRKPYFPDYAINAIISLIMLLSY